MTTGQVAYQIADAGLLDSALTRSIKDRKDFDLDGVVAALVYSARDAFTATKNDPQATWQEKRMATGCLVSTFLSALLLAQAGDK
jgi:hypothetical protein